MRLPDLAGYRLEKLMGEDPFGWSFLAGKSETDKRLIRILKSQATHDQQIGGIYRHMTALQQGHGTNAIDKFSPRMVGTPAAVSLPFPGWKGKSDTWKLSSVSYLSRVMEKDAAVSSGSKILHTLGDLCRLGIYHGGLRPENIFLTKGPGDEPAVKITGFGEMVIPGIQHLEAASLPFFLAPEQLIHSVKSETKIAQWDVYSAGVIVYQILCHHLPRLDRLFRQYWANPEQMDKLVLIEQGKLTRNAGQIYQLLESEKDLVWPDQHSSETEKMLRLIVEKCLAFDATDRFKNLGEVSEALRKAERLLAEKQSREVVAPQREAIAPPRHPKPPLGSAAQKVATTDKITLKAPTAKSKIKTDESLEEIFNEVANANQGILRKIPLIRSFVSSPLLDKAIAMAGVAAIFGLTAVILKERDRLRASENERLKAVAELQENIKQQASNFQQKIALTVKSADNLKEDLDQVEETKAQLTSQASLARGLLRQTQDSGDQFFKLVLENSDTDVPAFRKSRKNALIEAKKHYSHLIEAYQDAPDFEIPSAHAHYYLGRIHKEMGEIEDALSNFEKAEHKYLKLMETERNAEFTENLAISKRELGKLAFKNSAYTHSTDFFTQSNQYWHELGNLDTTRTLDASIEMNLNSLSIVECLKELGKREPALNGAEEIVGSFTLLQERHPDDERVVGGLARSFEIVALLFENVDREKALKAFGHAITLYSDAILKNASVDRYHLGLGNSLARSGLLTNDIKRMDRAVKILSQVVPRNPYEPTALIALADVYGVLSGNQRDGGKSANAMAIEEQAINLLRPLMENNKVVPVEVYHAYSKRLVHLAELRVDGNKFESSRIPLKEAIDILAQITESESAPATYRRTLATARGLYGFASLRSGDRSSAKSYYSMAQKDWSTYISQYPNDRDAADNARWASEQLRELQ